MYKAAIIASAIASAAAGVIDLENISFEDHVEHHALTFKGALSGDSVNSSLTMSSNVCETIMPLEEKQAYLGRSKSMHHARKRLGAIPLADTSGNKLKPISELPENVDWRNNGIVSAVKDQGQCGSCWAFASTAVMESAVAKATGLLFDLSVQQMAMCAPNPDHCGGTGNCEGSTAELAYEYASKSGGILEEYMYSYGAYYGNVTACNVPVGPPKAAISGYKVLPANQMEPLMNAIANDGPLAVNVDANSWFAYSSGIFNGCDSAHPDIDHVVAIVGYGQNDQGKKFWLIRNSWSASWGEQGYMKLLRQDTQEEVDATCCTDVTPGNGIACENDLNPEHVCGTCGVLFDSVLPTGAVAL